MLEGPPDPGLRLSLRLRPELCPPALRPARHDRHRYAGALAAFRHRQARQGDRTEHLANTFGDFPGFRKDFVTPETIKELSNLLIGIAAVQTVAGAILLFLFGLAIRNRFRMYYQYVASQNRDRTTSRSKRSPD